MDHWRTEWFDSTFYRWTNFSAGFRMSGCSLQVKVSCSLEPGGWSQQWIGFHCQWPMPETHRQDWMLLTCIHAFLVIRPNGWKYLLLIFFTSFIIEINMDTIFRKRTRAKRGVPSREDGRLWEDSNSQLSSPKATALSAWPAPAKRPAAIENESQKC